ncbi:DUF1080 domain-containing protein [Verrucomicrobium sp. BvORR034]|jgi:hypothetical protein|uniref:3-keto-disaccharide hydrolase n=1 Tax=Verrucomicrobium sp. BvORR034 TaxID=1396418 RepID=UPI00067918A0|nr:DUF1080 domain-containing protein [Verrucomicrobium sp. BvORR034]
MKTTFLTLLSVVALSAVALAEDGWTSMFNGKDLSGWKSNEEVPGSFTVEDGKLKVSGGRAHIFFVGADGNAKFKNFEFKAKFMTTPGANGGIYIHTTYQDKGWPEKGYECQVNATHTDRKKTGGLYAVQDVLDNAPNKDNVWSDYYIKVEGKHITIKIDGKTTVDWTQPDDWDPAKSLKGMPGRSLSEGTIAIQGHDPKSVAFYKDLEIKPLP